MYDAIVRDGELLAEALTTILSGARPEAEALADYERRRNEATLPGYRSNVEQAKLAPPPPELLQLREAIRGDQEATNRFYLEQEGLIGV